MDDVFYPCRIRGRQPHVRSASIGNMQRTVERNGEAACLVSRTSKETYRRPSNQKRILVLNNCTLLCGNSLRWSRDGRWRRWRAAGSKWWDVYTVRLPRNLETSKVKKKSSVVRHERKKSRPRKKVFTGNNSNNNNNSGRRTEGRKGYVSDRGSR